MRKALLALAASTLLVAPAMAQTSGSQSGNAGNGSSMSNMNGQTMGGCSGMGGQQASTSGSGAERLTVDQVHQELKKSGLKDVQLLNASYLVRATAPNNECVLMIIDTSQSNGMGGQAGASLSGSQQGQTNSQANAGQNNSGQGSSNQTASNSGQNGTMQTGSTRTGGSTGANREAMLRSSKDVTAQLKQAGYSDISVLDASYAASGSLSGGTPVMLVIGAGAEATTQQ